jgi:hypothetical protein
MLKMPNALQEGHDVQSEELFFWMIKLSSVLTDRLSGDDCVSMVGNCSEVRVKDISCGPGHGIR